MTFVPSIYGLHLLLLMLTNCWHSLTNQALSVAQCRSIPILVSDMQCTVVKTERVRHVRLACLSKSHRLAKMYALKTMPDTYDPEDGRAMKHFKEKKTKQNSLWSIAVQTPWKTFAVVVSTFIRSKLLSLLKIYQQKDHPSCRDS